MDDPVRDVVERPVGRDDDLVADRLVVLARREDDLRRAPRLAAVRRLREVAGARVGGRPRVVVRIVGRQHERVPHRVGSAIAIRIGRHRVLVRRELAAVGLVDLQPDDVAPRLAAVLRDRREDTVAIVEPVEADGVRVDDPVGADGDPGVGCALVDGTPGAAVERERRLVPRRAPVGRVPRDEAVCPAVRRAILLPRADDDARILRADRDVRLDLGIDVRRAGAETGRARGIRTRCRHERRRAGSARDRDRCERRQSDDDAHE